MSLVTFGKVVAIWLAILMVAILNGIFREAVLVPRLGNTPGLLLSGLLLSFLILVVAYVAAPWLGVTEPAQLAGVGLVWLAFTLIFEFSFGLWQGKPLSEILEAYTFKGGNLWPLVLLVTALAPWLAAEIRGWL